MGPRSRFEVRLEAVADAQQVAPLWHALCATTRPSFFQSWDWIGNWLTGMPATEQPLLLAAYRDGTPQAACFLVRKSTRRHLWVPSTVLHVNVTGERDYNLNPEYNGILATEAATPDVQAAMLAFLVDEVDDWDEIYLPATGESERQQLRAASRALGLRLITRHRAHCYRVDLAALRHAGTGYRQTLSRNARYQLNRAFNRYRQAGKVRIEQAPDLATAYTWFEELKALHTASWRQRGYRGTFDKKYWEPFHRSLMAHLFPAGRIQMLRIRAGDTDIGYLYNVLDGKQVLFIQSGFRYSSDPHLKPGYVSHTLAIENNLHAGLDSYNFLAGDERYKNSLAQPADELYWLAIQKPRLRFSIENGLRRLLRPG
ncbi:MAG TPA: GNAT family N-acetyltransferase [Gammaproteobacteria bacterium]|nr:GNAT family N-acetyltransferase [Gammaproteobacteria bacterium]